MKKYSNELSVGVFIFLGLLCVAYLTLKLGNIELFDESGYTLTAEFSNISGLRQGAEVSVAGVNVGKVAQIELSYRDNIYRAKLHLRLQEGLEVYDDAAVAIKTSGIIGDKYVELQPGGASDTLLANGDVIEETNSTIDLESLISKFAVGGVE